MVDMSETTIRSAAREDVPLILEFIRELAEYEKLSDEVVATEAGLAETLFGERPYAEALIAEAEGKAAGFALFFHNYSTFLGKPGIYLEDVFVRPEFRGRGVGRAFFRRLARIALERDCGRLEFWVLDWNQPAIRFYRKLGAEPMAEWTVQRITGEALRRLADRE
jgi:GNAT superfamily N-acetyltransferase